MVIQQIITAASDTERMFIDAGFGKPRNLVRVDDREVLLRAMDSYSSKDWDVRATILQSEDLKYATGSLIETHVNSVVPILTPFVTRGALITSLMSLEGFNLNDPLVIAAGDSELEGGISEIVLKWQVDEVAAGTIGFLANETRWSYVQVDDLGNALQVAEKQVIGPYATIGVFYFQRVIDFIESATWCLVNNAHVNNIYYTSSALNYMISRGKQVVCVPVDRSKYRSWSLPVDFVKAERLS